MRTGLAISTGLHVAVFAVAWFGLPELRRDDIFAEQLVIVDMVDISEVTNTPTAAAEPEKVEEPKPEPPKPEPDQAPPPPPPAAEAPPPPPPPAPTEPAPKPVAEAPKPEPAPVPKPAPKKTPKEKEVAQAPAPAPKPKPKPRKPVQKPEKKAQKKDKQVDFSRLLKTLEKTEPQAAAKPKPDEPEKKKKADPLKDVLASLNAPARSRSNKAFDPENKISLSEIDAVKRQIAQCWNVPAGAKGAEDLMIEITIQMRADGSVRDAQIVDQGRLASDDFFRSAAESARRAVLSCGKLPLSPEKFDSWKNITMTFNPKDLL